jgi:hypothetical protein
LYCPILERAVRKRITSLGTERSGMIIEEHAHEAEAEYRNGTNRPPSLRG